MIYLYLPVSESAGEWISASGSVSEKLLCQLADVLHLRISNAGNDWRVRISDEPPRNWMEEKREKYVVPCALYRHPEKEQWTIVPGKDGGRLFLTTVAAMHLALLCQVMQGNTLVMHGALLRIPQTGMGVILFGESGMGKTTASMRFKSQGGEVCSDDRLLVTISGDGTVLARSIPTWSRFPEPAAMPFDRTVPVKGLFMLFRGEDDKIEPAPLTNWQIAFFQSVSDTCFAPRWLLSPEQRKPVLAACAPLMEKMVRKFGTRQICGDLNGRIFEHISTLCV